MNQQPKTSNRVLILGGTNFMGKTLLDCINKSLPNYEVYCINRGRSYWNNQARNSHKNYHHYTGDRNDHKDMTKLIKYINNKIGIDQKNPWKAVVDFSGFKWRDVQSVVKGIEKCVEVYIFISSDSVYNATKQKLQVPVKEDTFDLEYHYNIEKENKKKKDKYGYNKLKCQLYLRRTKYVPFICLRLPDVIGPYDDTNRMWCTLKWIQSYPIPITPYHTSFKMSFVYSLDVANQIIKIIHSGISKSDSFNVCFKQTLTCKQLIDICAQLISANPNFIESAEQFDHYYPSVDYGFIDSGKAEKQLSFVPTLFVQALKQTINFFMKADQYIEEKKQMEKQFKQKIVNHFSQAKHK